MAIVSEGARAGDVGFSRPFWSAVGGITALLGAASLVHLLREGVEIELAAPMRLAFDAYDAAAHTLGELVQPALEAGLAYVRDTVGWSYRLVPNWQHILIAYIAAASALARSGPFLGKGARLRFVVPMILILGGVSLGTALRPEGDPSLLGSNDIVLMPLLNGGVLLLVGMLLLLWSFFARADERQSARGLAWALLTLPLAVIFLLATNAGIVAVTGAP